MASFERDGLSLGYDDDGSGPAIVLLHGRAAKVVLRADSDLGPAFTAEDEERFLRTNPHARAVVVEGASHQIHDEQPDCFLDELSTLAASVAA